MPVHPALRLFLLTLALLGLSLPSGLHASPAGPCGVPPADTLVKSLVRQAPGLKEDVLRLALTAKTCARQRGLVKRDDIITVIDYSIPSDEPRLFTFDLSTKKLVFRELVAHGKNSGGNLATAFSNVEGSLATSLGLFATAGTYMGSNGYSLRLRGLERGVNDNAWQRAIVMHGAPYVNRGVIRSIGRLGRSWGCPAVRSDISKAMIDRIKGGSAIFAYYPDHDWLATSAFVGAATRMAQNKGGSAGGSETATVRR
ncbi:MAG TPA: murein L,D-transpeptidase catalytic domain family protein [Thermoanaerobaculia bacterium]